MRNNLLCVLMGLICSLTFSQISFEKGYFIDNSNNKVTCLIKNLDWKNNPTQFEYKLSEVSESQILDVNSVKEFGIDNDARYIQANVNIERSNPNFASNLTDSPKPQFREENLFLKVLIQGKANLYIYTANNITKYFYNVDDSNIEQLIYIRYNASSNIIQKNQYYKQQLWLNLKCDAILMNSINKLEYKKNDLINFFTKFNACNQSETINYHIKQSRSEFNLTLRPRLNHAALSIETYQGSSPFNVDFDSKLNFGIGIEAEFVLPFNKNKWALLIEPTYHTYTNEKTYERHRPYSPSLFITASIDYKSIELPLGIRHYFFLNDKSKIFINGIFTMDFLLNSKLDYTTQNGANFGSIDIYRVNNNFSFGAGYKYNNKYSIELRNNFKRDILKMNALHTSNYNSLSLIFGYTLF